MTEAELFSLFEAYDKYKLQEIAKALGNHIHQIFPSPQFEHKEGVNGEHEYLTVALVHVDPKLASVNFFKAMADSKTCESGTVYWRKFPEISRLDELHYQVRARFFVVANGPNHVN